MREPRNRVVQVNHFGGREGLEVVDAPLSTARRGEVRVRVLACVFSTLAAERIEALKK
jgi:NADPH:quinone reductase